MEEDARLKWFGKSWGAPICTLDSSVSTPIGVGCAGCAMSIKKDDAGLLVAAIGISMEGLPPNRVAYHYECFMMTLLGKRGGHEPK